LNKEIYYIKGDKKIYAKAIDIAKDGSLIIINTQGETVKLNTGEISIRKL
ncbi:MAG: biotin--[acetyl-CoA-carboxylase] ligase, partial [Tissierellia bacterium]|nr:biotin--[acetyl-CoA-carboxylase] ligase [Tissierellia bacterium]